MFNDFISLIYPRTCELCGAGLARGEKWLCTRCIRELPRIRNEMYKEEIIHHLIEAHKYSGFYSYLKFHKKGLTQKLLHKIKYQKRPVLAEIIGQWLGHELTLAENVPEFDLIIPVPLHPGKQKIRGYNQSDYFAKGLAHVLDISWSTRQVVRTVNNESQTNKSRQERLDNVRNVFQVINKMELCDKRILLVDDVITTGATLESCAEQILASGPRSISLATIAIAR